MNEPILIEASAWRQTRLRTILAVIATLALVVVAASGVLVAYEARHQSKTQRRAACYTQAQAEVAVVMARAGLFEIQDWEYGHPRRVDDWLRARTVAVLRCP